MRTVSLHFQGSFYVPNYLSNSTFRIFPETLTKNTSVASLKKRSTAPRAGSPKPAPTRFFPHYNNGWQGSPKYVAFCGKVVT